ncbi:MAG: tetratricopeptide repeat protein [Chloroflexi bacterium]|jgi:tetratricopeptide (TPR) repeat protein|nr:tetratricopeptide repeat protein [Chloroflexota bacterium]
MRSIISLVCGIMVVVGAAFVSWLSIDETGQGGLTRFFGREVMGGDVEFVNSVGPLFTLIGGILIIVFALVAFLLLMMNHGGHRVFVGLILGARIVALFAIVGIAWYLIDIGDVKDELGAYYEANYYPDGVTVIIEEGVWISLIGAVGSVVSGATAPFSVWRWLIRGRDFEENAQEEPVSVLGSRTEEYYESAAVGGSESTASLRKDYYESHKAGLAADSPGSAEEHFKRAIGFESEGKYPEAVAEYDAAITSDPNYAQAYSNRGSLHLVQGNMTNALFDFERVIELSDDPHLTEMAQSRIDELNEQTPDEGEEYN